MRIELSLLSVQRSLIHSLAEPCTLLENSPLVRDAVLFFVMSSCRCQIIVPLEATKKNGFLLFAPRCRYIDGAASEPSHRFEAIQLFDNK